jgi:outer membrane protein
MALVSRISVLLALVSRQAAAEELTAERAADRAVRASYDVAAARSTERAAQAGVDQASAAFLPRVDVSATYTRLSDFTPSPLFPFGIVATNAPAGTVSPPSVSTRPVSIEPAGVAITWSPTEIPGAGARASESDARSNASVARRDALRDAIAVEVAQFFEAVHAADARVVATDKQLQSATEAYRVTRSQFANARATTSNVLDAETDLARARLAWVNARIDARVARAQLDHAAGRDQSAARH